MSTGHPQESLRAVGTLSIQGARPSQEDALLVRKEKGIFVVADGFGGGAVGLGASRLACESVSSFLEREAGDRDATLPFVIRQYYSLAANVLFNALLFANQRLLSANRGKNANERGGASVLAAYLDGDLLALANVGGCSARLIRGGKSSELVIPRSYARLMDPTAQEARSTWDSPLMALGMTADVEPEIMECRVRSGDWIVLHSDGLDPRAWSVLEKEHALTLPGDFGSDRVEEVLKRVKEDTSLGTSPDNLAITLMIF